MNFPQIVDSVHHTASPQLSLVVLGIFLICAVLVFIRGVFRIFVGSATLAAAVYVGLWAWRGSGSIAVNYTGKPLPWLDVAWPVVAGLLTIIVLRLTTNFVIKPLPGEDPPRPGLFARLVSLPFAVLPAALICAAGVLLVQHVGTLGELRSFADRGTSAKRPEWARISEDLKKSVQANIPTDWLLRLDSLTQDHMRLTLAKLITAKADNDVPPRAIPVLEEPALKAIVVDEARLKKLAREKHYGSLLNHPDVEKAIKDPKVREALGKLDL